MYNNRIKKFWQTTWFHRLTAGMGLLACWQANSIVNGYVIATIDIVFIAIVGTAIYKLYNLKKRKYYKFQ